MKNSKIVVLGCGMVGATIARDLAADSKLDVTVADVNPQNLARLTAVCRARAVEADLGCFAEVAKLAREHDIAVGALPSHLGLAALKAVIEAGKPYVDISFMAEDAMDLDALAKERGVAAVVDCGVAPGLANVCIGYAALLEEKLEDVAFYVGGLPRRRSWPYQYKAPFSPADVLEEYTRPVRLVENGQVLIKPALSEPELMDFPQVGTLEAFNTDGLRSLIRTIPARNMKEKTLRYPGHIELMRALRETGFFSKTEVEVGNARVRPLDLTAKLLFPKWTLTPGEQEFTILRVVVEGITGSRRHRHVFELYDETDQATGQTSMARTTGFPCAIVTRMLASGEIGLKGVLPPELLGRLPGFYERLTDQLAARGVNLTHRREEVETSPAAV